MVKIADVLVGSPADNAGIIPGDYLISINGNPIKDVLDYSFYISEKNVTLKIHRDADLFDVIIKKREYSDIGLEFDTFLMDNKRSCRNKCVFCFIDQNPAGMRDTIYFKDDDSRLSFLQGSYITMTNMNDDDINRIIEMKTSPINISVHTTNPALREKMLCNKNAGLILEQMKRLAGAGIKMNCQIVLCKSLNDGKELSRTMSDLEKLYPSVQSVSVVPAGLTKHRQGLYPLEPFTRDECCSVIDMVEAEAKRCRSRYNSRLFWCSDEFYIKAHRPIHSEKYYEGYPQLENGVGMITSFKTEFDAELLNNIERYNRNIIKTVSIATGVSAYDFIYSMSNTLMELCSYLRINVYRIRNDFYGDSVTVAGLLTGRDIMLQLKGKELGEKLLLSSSMLKSDDNVFLDDMRPHELEAALQTKIVFVENNGAEFIKAILKK